MAKVKVTKDGKGHIHIRLPGRDMAGLRRTLTRGMSKDAKAEFVVRHDPVREKKGLKSWGVFRVEAGLNRGMSAHATEAEANAEKAKLERSSTDAADCGCQH